jgi:hypothetical protein
LLFPWPYPFTNSLCYTIDKILGLAMNIKDLLNLNYYTSELDEFLMNYDKTHAKCASASQKYEKDKHRRIKRLRDNAEQDSDSNSFWQYF